MDSGEVNRLVELQRLVGDEEQEAGNESDAESPLKKEMAKLKKKLETEFWRVPGLVSRIREWPTFPFTTYFQCTDA